MKTKIKSHDDEVTDFHDKEIPKADSNHACIAVISLDSALNKDDNYYLQVFLKDCKYTKKKVIRHITQDSIVFFFDERLKKIQKRNKVFPYLDYPYTLDYKKVWLTILIKSYAALQSLFAL